MFPPQKTSEMFPQMKIFNRKLGKFCLISFFLQKQQFIGSSRSGQCQTADL